MLIHIDNGCSSEQDSVWQLDWPCTEAGSTAVVNCPSSAEGTYIATYIHAQQCLSYGLNGLKWPKAYADILKQNHFRHRY